jgi:hypothetical protein
MVFLLSDEELNGVFWYGKDHKISKEYKETRCRRIAPHKEDPVPGNIEGLERARLPRSH